jgi:hypothetical protein
MLRARRRPNMGRRDSITCMKNGQRAVTYAAKAVGGGQASDASHLPSLIYSSGGTRSEPYRSPWITVTYASDQRYNAMPMALDTIAELLTLALAVAAILVDPKRDQSAPASWPNLTPLGRITLIAILCLSGLKLAKLAGDAKSARRKDQERQHEVTRLRETNDYLIKAVSVGSGYNAIISGVATFYTPPSEDQTEKALKNLFLKYADIELSAVNKFGVFEGRIDHGTHPEPRLYLRLTAIGSDGYDFSEMKHYVPSPDWPRSVAFKIRCGNLKLLNAQKIQYVVVNDDGGVRAHATKVSFWSDFKSLYRVSSVYLDRITIEEIGDIPLRQHL